MGKRAKLIIFAIGIILLGFLRDYLFYNINWVYKTLTENRPLQALEEFHFLLEWSPEQILLLKWMLTIVFFGVFGLFTWIIIKTAFQNPTYNKISWLFYAGLLLLSGVMFVVYKLLGSPSSVYAVVRTLMGLGQSFIPLLLLFVAFKFFPKSSQID